jgi:Transcriptional regulatory protein, C terminal
MVRRRSTPQLVEASPRFTRLGTLAPLPLFGREQELAVLEESSRRVPLTVLVGPVGTGKTTLSRAVLRLLGGSGGRRGAYVQCEAEDDAGAVIARAERALGAVPGTLGHLLATTPILLVLDDVQRLAPDAAHLVLGLARKPGHVLAVSHEPLALPRDSAGRFELTLEGLAYDDAARLWGRLEESCGPTPQGSSDKALSRALGVPMALRREYARAAVEPKAWDLAALPAELRRTLVAIAAFGAPLPPSAVAFLAPPAPGSTLSRTLAELVKRQLVEPTDDGRLDVHDLVRHGALALLEAPERKELAERTVELLHADWSNFDATAAAMPLDVAQRLRLRVRHLLAADRVDEAVEALLSAEDAVGRQGASAEALPLTRLVAEAGGDVGELQARLLGRLGRIAEAADVLDPLVVAAPTPARQVAAAELALAGGDLVRARELASAIPHKADAEIRVAAIAVLAQADILAADFDAARERLRRGMNERSAPLVAKLRFLAALVEESGGTADQTRQALGRIAGGALLGAGAAGEAGIAVAAAGCLVEDGRFTEAEQALGTAERAARENDEPTLGDELRRRRAALAERVGRLEEAEEILGTLAADARSRGQELAALRAEAELAHVLAGRGRAPAALQLASAVAQAAARRGLKLIHAEALLAQATAEIDELRAVEALGLARRAISECPSPRVKQRADRIILRACAWLGEAAPPGTGVGDQLVDERLVAAEQALARADHGPGLGALEMAAAAAERAGRRGDVARALADAARLHRARGARQAAGNAAARAVAEGAAGGLDRAVARATLVVAALARDDGELSAARVALADALTIARAAGLAVERYVAATASGMVAREAGDVIGAERLDTVSHAALATMTDGQRIAADRILSELGLGAQAPFRITTADGSTSFATDAESATLGFGQRELVVDGSSEQVYRKGKSVADLRRRTLLKRLLFLFASAPGKLFSKEDIVRKVWEVEYHPLRHDAALFTNVMRLRRLLGEGGQDLLRVAEGGYVFAAPRDFLFVDKIVAGAR